MNKITKMVNIYPSMPITRVNPPIRTTVKRVTKSVEEIKICLISKAIVEELLPTGGTVRLTLSNYNKNNHIQDCTCKACVKTKIVNEPEVKDAKTKLWEDTYYSILKEKNVTYMTRKQRRAAEASAKAAADAAVAKLLEAKIDAENTVSENVEESVEEEIVETIDIEAIE